MRDDGKEKPFLANTTMESYERSNCMGCHAKSKAGGSSEGGDYSTDFMYWLKYEVAAAGNEKETVPD